METTATFGGLELVTSPCVMTPRETSTGLVVCATDHLEGRPGVVVDVGTGSGAIALAVAETAPNAAVWATDVSSAAVKLARLNARRAGLHDRVTVRCGNLLDPFPGTADVIVANLPYLPLGERQSHPELAVGAGERRLRGGRRARARTPPGHRRAPTLDARRTARAADPRPDPRRAEARAARARAPARNARADRRLDLG